MKNTRATEVLESTSKAAEKGDKISLSLRDQYLLEIERIKHEIGDLEQIRTALGLSQRRMCQLLLVDPSAWTRWNKTSPPPHIYKALKWLIELKKINPEAAAPSNISNRVDLIQSSTQSKIKELEGQITALERAFTVVSPVYSSTPYIPHVSSESEGDSASVSASVVEQALQRQESHFQNEIEKLKLGLEQLLAKKTGAKRIKVNKRTKRLKKNHAKKTVFAKHSKSKSHTRKKAQSINKHNVLQKTQRSKKKPGKSNTRKKK